MEKAKFRTKSNEPNLSRQEKAKSEKTQALIQFDKKKFNLKIEEISKHQKGDILGDDMTFLALKDPTSYMIATDGKGLEVIENRENLYSATLKVNEETLKDIIYINHLDCYLIYIDFKLYRKDVDSKPPYLYLDINCPMNESALFIYSKINKKLLISSFRMSLLVVDLQETTPSLEINRKLRNEINDFCFFGEEEKQIVCETISGGLSIFIFNFDLKKICAVYRCQFQLLDERSERPSYMAVDDQNKYIILEVTSIDSDTSSRMLLFELRQRELVLVASIDRLTQSVNDLSAIGCCGNFGSDIVWIGLTIDDDGFAEIFCFNTESREFVELEKKRVIHQELFPFQMHRLESQFYYTGLEAKVMKLTYEI